jgi:hypothetical protein
VGEGASAVPTLFRTCETAVGTLRFAHPTDFS